MQSESIVILKFLAAHAKPKTKIAISLACGVQGNIASEALDKLVYLGYIELREPSAYQVTRNGVNKVKSLV
jgi:predicted transcriptional regulator